MIKIPVYGSINEKRLLGYFEQPEVPASNTITVKSTHPALPYPLVMWVEVLKDTTVKMVSPACKETTTFERTILVSGAPLSVLKHFEGWSFP